MSKTILNETGGIQPGVGLLEVLSHFLRWKGANNLNLSVSCSLDNGKMFFDTAPFQVHLGGNQRFCSFDCRAQRRRVRGLERVE